MSRPTVADASARASVVLTHRGWTGELLFVDGVKDRAKVRLKSGTVVFVPLDQLDIRAAVAPHRSDNGAELARADTDHDRQAG
jgi:hypothetical protein